MPLLSQELKEKTISMLVSRRVKDMISDDRRLALKELFEGGANIRGYNSFKEEELLAEVNVMYQDGLKQGDLTAEERSVFENVITLSKSGSLKKGLLGFIKGAFGK